MSIWHDVRLAIRLLLRDRTFTLTAILALALGIAANSLVFTLVNGVLLRDLPVAAPDRLVAVESRDTATNGTANVSYPDFRDLQGTARSLSALAAYRQGSMALADASGAERLTGAYISADTFRTLGVSPMLGRDLRADDDRLGAEPVVLLGHALWQRRYGARAGVIGQSVRVNGTSATIVGVMPERFGFPEVAELWQPLVSIAAAARDRRDVRIIDIVGRLVDGGSAEQAAAELNAVMAGLAARHPATNRHIMLRVFSFRESVVGRRAIEMFSALMGAVAFLLVMACANVANLLLARASTRAKEIAIRASMGASRWRIVRQLLIESVVLAIAAGAVGLAIGVIGVRTFVSASRTAGAPYWLAFPIDVTVLSFVALVCLGTAVACGLFPALHAVRTNVGERLNDAGRAFAGSVRSRRWGGTLVVVQVAVAVVLLTGGALMLRSAAAAYWRDAGIDTTDLLTMRIELPGQKYSTPERRAAFYRELDARLAAAPDLRATIGTPAPRMGGPERWIKLDGAPVVDAPRRPRATSVAVGRRYFETLGIGPRLGRTFTDLDEGRPVVVVNERFAGLYLAGTGALGQRIELGPDGPIGATGWLTIVGVVPNVRQNDEEAAAFDPVVYLPATAGPLPNAMLLARSGVASQAVIGRIRSAVRDLDADMALFEVATLDEALESGLWPLRIFGTMFGAFAISALTLASLGLYAMTAYLTAQRTREIGVRVALGARPLQVWWTVSRRVAFQLAAGLVLGLAGAVATAVVLASILAGVRPADPVTFTVVPLLLVIVGFVACLIPARRAIRLDPMTAMRAE
jgi:putative ABC transport system permease protein